jgi:hypothetical protein
MRVQDSTLTESTQFAIDCLSDSLREGAIQSLPIRRAHTNVRHRCDIDEKLRTCHYYNMSLSRQWCRFELTEGCDNWKK